MPLHDHFHPPLGTRRHWRAFHNSWATYISSDLNRRLPPEYFAEANVQFGIEIDVAAFQESDHSRPHKSKSWSPGPPTLTIPLPLLTDIVEVAVYHQEGGPILVGAVELVSPANKDRPEHRAAFVSKCQAYVQEGIGLVMVDVVTQRRANLHNQLLARLKQKKGTTLKTELFAAAYRPVRQNDESVLEVWSKTLQLDRPLPIMALWLRGGPSIPVDLEATYRRTCAEQRISVR